MRELAQHVTDLVENSVRAGARRIEIELEESRAEDRLVLRVRDDGYGMGPAVLQNVTDPFFTTRTCRKVGLGLPLLRASTQRSGGSLSIESAIGKGTTVEASFRLSHIDAPPVGDLTSSIICAIIGHEDIDVCFRWVANGRAAEVDSGDIKEELGGVSLAHPVAIRWLEQVVSEAVATAGDITELTEESHAKADKP